MVGCARVRNNKAIQISRRDGPEERGNQIRREDDVITRCHDDKPHLTDPMEEASGGIDSVEKREHDET